MLSRTNGSNGEPFGVHIHPWYTEVFDVLSIRIIMENRR